LLVAEPMTTVLCWSLRIRQCTWGTSPYILANIPLEASSPGPGAA
jgi:hypothetical protein